MPRTARDRGGTRRHPIGSGVPAQRAFRPDVVAVRLVLVDVVAEVEDQVEPLVCQIAVERKRIFPRIVISIF